MKNFKGLVCIGVLVVSAFANFAMADCLSDVKAAASTIAVQSRQNKSASELVLDVQDVIQNNGTYTATFLETLSDYSRFPSYVSYTVNIQSTGADSCKIINFVEQERWS